MVEKRRYEVPLKDPQAYASGYINSLSDRRRSILQLCADGLTRVQAATELNSGRSAVDVVLGFIAEQYSDKVGGRQGPLSQLIYYGVRGGALTHEPSEKPQIPLSDIEQKLVDRLIRQGMSMQELGEKAQVEQDVLRKLLGRILEKRNANNIYRLASSMGYEDKLGE